MLPAGRGQAPIPWTIIKDLKRTALSVFFLVAEADAGPIIAQYELEIRDRENSASLFIVSRTRISPPGLIRGVEPAVGGAAATDRGQ